MSIPTSIRIELPHTEGITWHDCEGHPFTVTEIWLSASIFNGRLLESLSVSGSRRFGEGTNATVYDSDHPFGQPPAWFTAAVDEMRASVRTPEQIAREQFQQTLNEFAALGPDSDTITQGDN